MGDDEADMLFPPKTWAEVDARHQEREVAAGRRLDYDDDELHDALFGNTTGREAGGS
jgi:hypothetical protein